MFRLAKGCHQYFSLQCIIIFVIHHLFWTKVTHLYCAFILAHVCKLTPSSITNVRIFKVKENLSSNLCSLGTIGTPLLSSTLNNLMVTCFTSQSFEIKFTISTNTSHAPFDIDESKVQVVDKQSTNVGYM